MTLRRSQDFLVGLLSDLYNKKSYSDVRVFHKSQVISLHGSVLSSVSPFWKKILENGGGDEDFVEIIFDDWTDFESCSTIFELAYKGSTNIKKHEKDKLMDIGSFFGMKLTFVEEFDHLYPCYGSPASPLPTVNNDVKSEDSEDSASIHSNLEEKKDKKTRLFLSDLSEDDLTCKVCQKKFSALYKLKIHSLIHSQTPPFVCSYCGKGFNNKYKMRTHEKFKHISNQSEQSDVVSPNIGQEKKLKSRKRKEISSNNIEAETLQCLNCRRNFKTQQGLSSHSCQNVSTRRHLHRTTGSTCSYICTICHQAFSYSRELRHHVENSGHRPQFKCEKCNTVCSSRKSLKIHGRTVHLDSGLMALPYHCPECGKAFLKQSYLEEHHNRFHLLVKPFPCMFCPKRCATKQDLDRHLASHRGEPAFQCSFCPKSFVHRATFKKHQRSHVGERPYQCRPCSTSYGLLSVLKKHHKSHMAKGDRTEIVTAQKGHRGCVTYLDWSSETRVESEPAKLEQFYSTTEDKIMKTDPEVRSHEAYIPSGQYIHTLTPVNHFQVLTDYGDILASFPSPGAVLTGAPTSLNFEATQSSTTLNPTTSVTSNRSSMSLQPL